MGVSLAKTSLCVVPCRICSGPRCWICSQGDSWPPERTPAQPQGHARTNLLGAALICWVKHCAEGLGCFHLQSCQGAISVGGSVFGAAGPQKPRHELLLPAGVGGLFQWV